MRNHRRPSILIVDDDYPCRVGTKRILEEAGYPVASCANAMEAISHMRRGAYHLVLVGQHLAVKNGFALLNSLQAENPGVSFILTAIDPDVSIQQEARRLGTAAFLDKPYGSIKLLAELDAWESVHFSDDVPGKPMRKGQCGRASRISFRGRPIGLADPCVRSLK